MLGEPQNDPSQASCPSGSWRIALLGIGAAVVSVIDIEKALVGDSSSHVVMIPAFPVVDRLTGRCTCVLDESLKKRYGTIVFFKEGVAKEIPEGQTAQGSDGVGKE